jgi:hypothetical protein
MQFCNKIVQPFFKLKTHIYCTKKNFQPCTSFACTINNSRNFYHLVPGRKWLQHEKGGETEEMSLKSKGWLELKPENVKQYFNKWVAYEITIVALYTFTLRAPTWTSIGARWKTWEMQFILGIYSNGFVRFNLDLVLVYLLCYLHISTYIQFGFGKFLWKNLELLVLLKFWTFAKVLKL